MQQTISVISDVKNLGELLDGARVDDAQVLPGGGRLRLELALTRACRERPPVGRRGLLTHAKPPEVKSRLVLGQITAASIQRRSGASEDHAPFVVCEAVAGGYEIRVAAPDGLRLRLTLEQLDGQFADVGEPVAPSGGVRSA